MQHSPQKPQQSASVKAAAFGLTAVIGALLSRWHGGGFISGSPKLLKAFLWSAPFAGATFAAWKHDHHGQGLALDFEFVHTMICAGVALIVLLACMVFKNTGHGGGMDLAHSKKEPGAGRTPEKLEYLILWLHKLMPRYRYDLLLLAIIGGFSTLFPAIAFGFVDILAAIPILAGGLIGKPLGYAIGWKLHDIGIVEKLPDELDEATEVGEFLTGLFAFGGLALATLMVI